MVQGAQVRAVIRKRQWAGPNPLNGLYGIDNIENRDCFRQFRQGRTAPNSALSDHQPMAGQSLQHFRKIRLRDLRGFSDLVGRAQVRHTIGEEDHRSQRVFHGLRKHWHPSKTKVDIDIHFSRAYFRLKVDFSIQF